MPVKIFFCSADEDEPLLKQLRVHLKPLHRQGLIDVWDYSNVTPGLDWKQVIDKYLNEADIIGLLISPDFMASDECARQIDIALYRSEELDDNIPVISVLLRPVDWKTTELSILPVLPSNEQPVTSWANQDEAFHNIAVGIRDFVVDIRIQQLSVEGNDLFKKYSYDKALHVYEEAIRLVQSKSVEVKANDVLAYRYSDVGKALRALNRHREALEAYEQAIQCNPECVQAYMGKGDALYGLNCDTEALAAYDKAIQLSPSSVLAYKGKAYTLSRLNRDKEARASYAEILYHSLFSKSAVVLSIKSDALYRLTCHEEAMISCTKAIQLDPDYAPAYNCKGNILDILGKKEEALASYVIATQLDPYYTASYYNKARVLRGQKRHDEALSLYQKAIDLDPDFVLAYEGRNSLLNSLGRYEEVKKYVKMEELDDLP